MDGPSSVQSNLPWFWIIEYLTSSQQVPTGILYDVLKEAPPLPDDLKWKVDELVALRCLEELCGVGYEPSASSVDLGTKVGFNMSETCQDVLECILQEASVSDIMTRKKPLQWDIKPFILHKRATMPKTALQQLKDATRGGNHPFASSLKMLSGRLSTRGLSDAAGEDTVPTYNRDLVGSQHQKIEANENIHEDQQGHDDADALPNAKKLKRAAATTSDRLGDKASCSVANGNSNLHNTVNCGSRLLKGSSVFSSCLTKKRKLVCNPNPENVTDNRRKAQQTPDDLDLDLVTDSQLKQYLHDALVPEEPAMANVSGKPDTEKVVDSVEDDELSGRRTTVGGRVIKENNSGKYGDPRRTSASGSENGNFIRESTVPGSIRNEKEREPSSSRDVNKDEEEIVVKKTEFLRSSNIADSLSTGDYWTERNVCVKCNREGQVLVCQMESCPLAVHEKCLGIPARFDESGQFFCPFCFYSNAVKEHRESQKEASSLSKDLTTFVCTAFEGEGGLKFFR